jgi:DNA-binding NarL/FixJ family response regulator
MSDRVRVAIVDDHPIFREGVAFTIRSSQAFEIVAEGACADEAVRIAKELLPDLILLDVSMPGGGIDAARAISAACPVVKVIMLTVSEQEEDVTQALEAGANGYILKGTSGTDLLTTLQSVSRGESYVSPGLAARLLAVSMRNVRQQPRPSEQVDLTKREEQILELVARGLTNKEIANTLTISEKTVKHYMTNVMQKLQVRNRVEAVLALQKKTNNT